MADDILHTGRADIHHPKGPLTAQQPLSRGERLRRNHAAQRIGRVLAGLPEEVYLQLDAGYLEQACAEAAAAVYERAIAAGDARVRAEYDEATQELAAELADERTLHQQTIRELETMREVARGNKRHVKYLTEECERLTAEVARVRADALRQAAQMLVTQPHVLDEIACANLLEAVARETTCGPNCREAHTYGTECAARRAVAAGEEQPMPDASRDAVELAARVLFEAGQVATDEETWQGITGDDRDSYRRVARAQLDAVAAASHLRGEPAARDARVRAAVAEDLRRTLAALNVALYWAHPDTPEGQDEIAGCRVALEMGQAALERLRAPAERVQDGSTDTTATPDPQRYWWHHTGCEGPTHGTTEGPRPCLSCGQSDGQWTRGEPITEEADCG